MMDQPIAGHRGIGVGASDPDARGPAAAVCLGGQQVIHARGSGRPHPAAVAEHNLDARPLFGDMQSPVGAEVHHHDDADRRALRMALLEGGLRGDQRIQAARQP